MTEPTPGKSRRNPADHLKDHRWKPGESGNPNGRPRGAKSLSDELRKLWNLPSTEAAPILKRLGFEDFRADAKLSLGQVLAWTCIGRAVAGSNADFREIHDRLDPRPDRREVALQVEGTMPSISLMIGQVLAAAPGECSLENLPPGLDLKRIAGLPTIRPRDDDTAIDAPAAGDGERDGARRTQGQDED